MKLYNFATKKSRTILTVYFFNTVFVEAYTSSFGEVYFRVVGEEDLLDVQLVYHEKGVLGVSQV